MAELPKNENALPTTDVSEKVGEHEVPKGYGSPIVNQASLFNSSWTSPLNLDELQGVINQATQRSDEIMQRNMELANSIIENANALMAERQLPLKEEQKAQETQKAPEAPKVQAEQKAPEAPKAQDAQETQKAQEEQKAQETPKVQEELPLVKDLEEESAGQRIAQKMSDVVEKALEQANQNYVAHATRAQGAVNQVNQLYLERAMMTQKSAESKFNNLTNVASKRMQET